MEQTILGGIPCDLIRPTDFWELCRSWLASDQFHHIVTLNPEMIMRAQKSSKFKKALQAADIRVADGTGIIWAHWYSRSAFWPLLPSLIAFMWRDIQRITGIDVITYLAKIASETKQSIYLVGGEAADVATTAKFLRTKYPGLIVHVARDHRSTLEGPQDIIHDIQEKKPAILFVAYGAVNQTCWIEHWRSQLPSVRLAVGVGGAFAILSESLPRAPYFFRTHNLEWLWRLVLEPQRLPRIWQATVAFPAFIRNERLNKAITVDVPNI